MPPANVLQLRLLGASRSAGVFNSTLLEQQSDPTPIPSSVSPQTWEQFERGSTFDYQSEQKKHFINMNSQNSRSLCSRECSPKEVKVDSERSRLKTVVPRVRYGITILCDGKGKGREFFCTMRCDQALDGTGSRVSLFRSRFEVAARSFRRSADINTKKLPYVPVFHLVVQYIRSAVRERQLFISRTELAQTLLLQSCCKADVQLLPANCCRIKLNPFTSALLIPTVYSGTKVLNSELKNVMQQ